MIETGKMAQYLYHRFLDEAGDTTFYGKGKVPVIGNEGVSKCFILGMLKINDPLNEVREKIINLQKQIESELYADLLSHLLKNKFRKYDKLVLNIAERKKCTTHTNLEFGLQKALTRAKSKFPYKDHHCKVVFNIQQPTNEPLL